MFKQYLYFHLIIAHAVPQSRNVPRPGVAASRSKTSSAQRYVESRHETQVAKGKRENIILIEDYLVAIHNNIYFTIPCKLFSWTVVTKLKSPKVNVIAFLSK